LEFIPESDKPPSAYLEILLKTLPVLFANNSIDLNLAVAVILVLLLVVASGLVSGSEVAYFSLTPNQLADLGKSETDKGEQILKQIKQPDYLLASILIANNLFNIGLVLCTNYLIFQLVDFNTFAKPALMEFVVNTIVIVPILVLFGEVFPKLYSTQYNVKIAKLMSTPLYWLGKFFSPLSYILIHSTKMVENRLMTKQGSFDFTELGTVIDLLVTDESTSKTQQMLKGIVEFANITVSQIQQARVNVIAIDQEEKFTDLLKTVRESNYSRIPIYKESIDDIIGIVYTKELLEYSHRGDDFDWSFLIKEQMLFVPESKKIDDMLDVFRENRLHMAVVVDEYGGTEGIVTLEDVVERVIGNIHDEYDEQTKKPKSLGDGCFEFDAKVLLIDLCKHYDIGFDTFDDERGESESIGGLLMEVEGGFPKIKQKIKVGNFTFTVLSRKTNKIEKVKVQYIPFQEEEQLLNKTA